MDSEAEIEDKHLNTQPMDASTLESDRKEASVRISDRDQASCLEILKELKLEALRPQPQRWALRQAMRGSAAATTGSD